MCENDGKSGDCASVQGEKDLMGGELFNFSGVTDGKKYPKYLLDIVRKKKNFEK